MKKTLIAFITSCCLLLSACTFDSEKAKSIVKSEIDTYYDNLLLENIDGAMKQIDRDSEQYYSLYNELRDTFQNYHYSYKIKEISFNTISKDRISVTAAVTISGVDNNEKYESFNTLQEFVFNPTVKDVWKINSL
jgi:outer membrane lipoprotein-sorting protein